MGASAGMVGGSAAAGPFMPIALGASAGLGFLGSFLSGRSAQPKAVPIPKPTAMFPGVSDTYSSSLMNSGVMPASFGTLAEMARTGAPTDIGPAFDAMKSSMGRMVDEGRSDVIEKFGVQGLRFGSDLDKAGVDFTAQTNKDFGSILAQFTMQAQEAAAQRRLAAASAGQGAGAELATTFAPTAVVAGGSPSPTGNGLSSASSSLSNFLMMQAMFPSLFKGAHA